MHIFLTFKTLINLLNFSLNYKNCDKIQNILSIYISYFNLIQNPFIHLYEAFCPIDKIVQWYIIRKNGWWCLKVGEGQGVGWVKQSVFNFSPPPTHLWGLEKFWHCLVSGDHETMSEWSWALLNSGLWSQYNEWYNCYFADSSKNSISAAVSGCWYFWAAHKIC